MTRDMKAFIPVLAIMTLVGFFCSLVSAQTAPETRVGLAQDWSHRHVRYSNTGTLQQRVNLMQDPRALHNLLDRNWHPNFQGIGGGGQLANNDERSPSRPTGRQVTTPSRQIPEIWRPSPFIPARNRNKNSKVDWAVSLGTGGQFPTGETPAKYQFDVTKPPDCANDFVVFPINATPSATQANIIAINNLYAGTSPTGQCGTTPTVMWSYSLGLAGTALSPVLSLDGKKVALIETGTRAILHVLTWQSGQGASATTPYSGTPNDVTLDFTSVAGTGCTNAASGASNASPYVDYGSDSAFLAADNGILYHVKNVFNGTPTMDFCTVVTANAALTSPVYDGNVKKVFISDGAAVFSFDFGASGFANKTSVTVARAGGIILSPMIDPVSQKVYVFSASNTANTNSIVSQIPYSFASHVETNIGVAASGYVLDGVFDNNFYTNSNPATWTLYACGRTNTNTRPALYGITFAADGTMNTTPVFSSNTTINPGNANGACSPPTEFYNAGVDRMFISTTGSNTVSMYNITSRLTAASTATATASGYNGGTGSFAVDNVSTAPQASSIYFGTMGTSTTTCPVTAAPASLSVQHAANFATDNKNTLSVTIPSTTAGQVIVVGMGGNSGTRTISSVTDNAIGGSDTFTQVAGARHTTSAMFTDMWVALKTMRSGATTVTISYSGNMKRRDAVVWVVTGFTNAGVDVASGINNGGQAGGTATGASVITTSSTDEFVAAFVNTSGAITANPKAGNEFTSGGDITGNGDAGASLITSTAGPHQPLWSDNGSSFASATVAFKESAGTSANYCAVKLTQSALQ